MQRSSSIQYLLLTAILVWLSANQSKAIPAFSRKHRFSCSMCHSPFPRLNKYGKDFAAKAFEPDEDDEQSKSKNFKDVGDDNLFVLRNFPLAVRTEMFFDISTDNGNGEVSDEFKTPWALKLLSGGNLAYDIRYYFSFYLGQIDQEAGIEQAVLEFNNIFGSIVDLQAGQFQIPTGLFRHELRPTFQDYLIYKAKPGGSTTSLSYDRGILVHAGLDMGFEFYASISNGNGLGKDDLAENFDVDKFKHFSLRMSQQLGPVRVGVFGYYGKEELTQDSDGQKWNNESNVWGPDLTLELGKAELNLQYIQRRDIKPTYGTTRESSPVFTQGLIAQVVANIMNDPAQMQAVFLFNYVDSDDPKIRQEAYSANVNYLLRTNIKLMAEYTFARVKDGLELNEHRATVGVMAGL